MKVLTCPVNGPRNIAEFVYGGEFRRAPDPDQASDEAWADYVFHRNGAPGIKTEWWFHAPSGTWFLAERDTQRDEILRTFLFGEAGTEGQP
jgi:sarcosine oxidase subunit delta